MLFHSIQSRAILEMHIVHFSVEDKLKFTCLFSIGDIICKRDRDQNELILQILVKLFGKHLCLFNQIYFQKLKMIFSMIDLTVDSPVEKRVLF